MIMLSLDDHRFTYLNDGLPIRVAFFIIGKIAIDIQKQYG